MSNGNHAQPDTAMPQYQQVKAYVSGLITSGQLKPGQRISSELELVREFSVSRMTVSRALNELVNEGAIMRVQGVGSFVAQSKSESALLQIRDISDEVAESGRMYSCTPLRVERSRSKPVNRLLGLGPDSVHFRTILLHQADGQPIQIENRCVNPKFAPDFIDQDFTKVTPYQHLMSLGPLQAAEHVFEAALPSPNEARWLNIGTDCPCIVLRRRTWSLNMVASFAIMTAAGARRRYSGGFGTLPPLAKRLPTL